MSDNMRVFATLLGELTDRREIIANRLEDAYLSVEAHRAALDDLDRAIAALEAPAQPLPSVEGVTVTPATEEDSGGPFIDAQASEPPKLGAGSLWIDAEGFTRVWDGNNWSQPLDTDSATPADPIVDAPSVEIPDGFTKWEGGECPVDANALVEIVWKWNDRQSFDGPLTRKAGEENWTGREIDKGYVVKAPVIAYRIIEEAGGYAPVTAEDFDTITIVEDPELTQEVIDALDEPVSVWTPEELEQLNDKADAFTAYIGAPQVELEKSDPTSVLDDPELQAAAQRAQATLVDAELDAELDRVREQERAKAKHHFSIFGKLEDA